MTTERLDIVRMAESENRVCQVGHALARGRACPSPGKYLVNGTPTCASHVWSRIRGLFAAMAPQQRKVLMVTVEAVRP